MCAGVMAFAPCKPCMAAMVDAEAPERCRRLQAAGTVNSPDVCPLHAPLAARNFVSLRDACVMLPGPANAQSYLTRKKVVKSSTITFGHV